MANVRDRKTIVISKKAHDYLRIIAFRRRKTLVEVVDTLLNIKKS